MNNYKLFLSTMLALSLNTASFSMKVRALEERATPKEEKHPKEINTQKQNLTAEEEITPEEKARLDERENNRLKQREIRRNYKAHIPEQLAAWDQFYGTANDTEKTEPTQKKKVQFNDKPQFVEPPIDKDIDQIELQKSKPAKKRPYPKTRTREAYSYKTEGEVEKTVKPETDENL